MSASTPRPRTCEWAAMRLMPRSSLLSETVTTGYVRSTALGEPDGQGWDRDKQAELLTAAMVSTC